MTRQLLPDDAAIPDPPRTAEFWLEPLGEAHAASDLDAWASSIAHIRQTPGFEGREWPPDEPFSLERNQGDMRGHVGDFAARRGFTYTVLAPSSEQVIGCLYIYPTEDPGASDEQVLVRSWVRADHADLDVVLYRVVTEWLQRDWPFKDVVYAPREL